MDFETTGLPKAPRAPARIQPRAIEFAAILFDATTRKEIADHVALINPQQPLETVITEITGIKDEDLADAPTFGQAWPDIEAFLRRADCLVAHNMAFDSFILAHELRMMGEAWTHWPPLICSVELFQPLWGRRMRLIELYQDVTGKEYEQTHRALDDVRALAEVLTRDQTTIDAVAAAARADGTHLPPSLRPDR